MYLRREEREVESEALKMNKKIFLFKIYYIIFFLFCEEKHFFWFN